MMLRVGNKTTGRTSAERPKSVITYAQRLLGTRLDAHIHTHAHTHTHTLTHTHTDTHTHTHTHTHTQNIPTQQQPHTNTQKHKFPPLPTQKTHQTKNYLP